MKDILSSIILKQMNQKKAILIGINYNNDAENKLRGCINDINNIRNHLTSFCGYDDKNIRVLTEENIQLLPTRENIERSINWLVSNNNPGDTLLFYYSGHGSSIQDRTGDESDGKDEVIIPLDFKTKGFITDDWLFSNMVQMIPKYVTLWAFTDCCHSGTLLDLKYNYKSLSSYKVSKTIPKNLEYRPLDWTDQYNLSLEKTKDVEGNIFLFSGCQDPETSADASFSNTFQGAFTYCLLEIFKKNIIPISNTKELTFNKNIKVRNLFKELNCRLDINGFKTQNSQLSLSYNADFESNFNI